MAADTQSQNNLGEVLRTQAGARAQQVAIIAPDTSRSLDYGGLAAFAAQLAAYFDTHDVPPGSRVAMLLPNGLTATALFISIMASGRIVAPLSLVSQPSQLKYIVDHCDPAVIFTCEQHEPSLKEVLGTDRPERIVSVDPLRVDNGPWAASSGLDFAHLNTLDSSDINPASDALLMYTSGTTGVPKGVPLSHANLLHAAGAVAQWHELTPDDRVLSALPLYHINGQVIATLSPFVSGGSIVAPERFSVSSWWEMASTWQCTWVNMVPTIIAYLLNAADQAPASLPRIRFARSASAPLPPDQQRRFEERFSIPVIEAMGMTESASVVFCNPMQLDQRKIGSPGLPVGVEARVVNANGREVPINQEGEIWLRGDNVMSGYYKSPEQTAGALTQDGWLRSGDLGRRDSDGFFFITGRLKELIIKGGENIAPREIDEALLQHPAILECAAVGYPCENYGQDILAAIVVKPGEQLDEAQVTEYCSQVLGKYKTPAQFRFVAELPKGPSGKVQRLKLLDI